MGGAKRLLEEQQARYDHALSICIESGAIEECENHPGSYYEGSESVETALEQAEDDEDAAAIQSAYDDNSGIDSCPVCARNMDD